VISATFDSISFSHIYKEPNMDVDVFSKVRHDLAKGVMFVNEDCDGTTFSFA
jgi:hypothetical protein